MGGIQAGVNDCVLYGLVLADGVHEILKAVVLGDGGLETLKVGLLRGGGVDLMDGLLHHDLGRLGALDVRLLHGAFGDHGLAGDCAVLHFSGINIESLVYYWTLSWAT